VELPVLRTAAEKEGKKGKKKQGKVAMMKNAMAMQKEMKKNPGQHLKIC
jgi:hypothetical protein